MKALLLLSGGFDSPVAGKLMQDKGLTLTALHYSFEPLTDNTSVEKSKNLAKHLGIKKLIVIKLGNLLTEISKKCKHKNYFVIQKRLFLKIAEKVAKEQDCEFLITGDNLGQVSSQTLSNLTNITKAVEMKILRPLLAYDKVEITKLAEQFKTYETSKGPEMCDILGPKHPVTKSLLSDIEWDEKNLEINYEQEIIKL